MINNHTKTITQNLKPSYFRDLCRSNQFSNHTSGICKDYIQTNLIILPQKYAKDFKIFCNLNYKPCPLVEELQIGDPIPHLSACNSNITTDLPKYHIYKDGLLVDIPCNIEKYWNYNLVAFLIGCSNSFENLIMNENIKLKHIEQDKCVPMYKTNIQTNRTEYFSGPLVVSMRCFKDYELDRVSSITERCNLFHGAPIHIGNPSDIGILNITKPDWGEPIVLDNDDIPVFWACGVTITNILQQNKLEFAISHAPGCMFITDLQVNHNLN